ncbi:WD repeat-containing protein RUP2-like [Typha angustifolia]|uniref:WD repeat-containing protein RUP2-like n=1 Tax=Typha angustifolia TaxID=59011 RepID=UPI003C2C4823
MSNTLLASMTTGSFQDGYKEEEEDLRPCCDWDFHLSAVVSNSDSSSDAIGAIDFSSSSPRLLATAGIARKIRIYSAAALLVPTDDDSPPRHVSSSCDLCICAPAKLSSVRFRPDAAGRVVGCGDYDGVVAEYDVERYGAPLLERDEHAGRRVWDIDYSSPAAASHGHLAASASDDRTAQLWDSRTCETVAVVRFSGAVCCVEFDPLGGPWLALGGADRNAYVYDVRKMGRGHVWEMEGHARAVTYVRFAGEGGRVVTSAADGTHRLWEPGTGRQVREYAGHVSGRSFVGMGVWRGGGLIASGSESNEVFVYDLRWGEPIWVRGFDGVSCGGDEKGFVSAVCWSQKKEEGEEMDGVLVAGGSDGVLQIFVCKRKEMDLD